MSNIENITFGIEIETTIPANAAVTVGGYHNGIAVVNGPAFGNDYWKAERDGSIEIHHAPGHVACEFVSPVLKGEAGIEHLIQFVSWLRAIGAKVNPSCGIHIHIGLNSFFTAPQDKARFVKILSRLATRNATALYAQTGSISRESGTYCKKADAEMRKRISRACRVKPSATSLINQPIADRYQLLNLTTINTRGTVEFRCFASTLEINAILCHLLSVLLLCKVAAARKSLTNWDATEQLSGFQSLTNLLKSRPTFTIVDVAAFNSRRESIIKAGFELAAKYDALKAAPSAQRPVAPLTVEQADRFAISARLARLAARRAARQVFRLQRAARRRAAELDAIRAFERNATSHTAAFNRAIATS